ncbi:MAG: FAD-dependent oxidoreductase [Armatimonadota bacterium]|nr:FAD-dependent oxidoreductase [Armatimonadota bacterium]
MRWVHEPARETPVVEAADVVVCGGGPAGVAAAVAAARAGADTRLLEAHGCLGGIWTSGLLAWLLDTAGKQGFMAEILAEMERRGARRGAACDVEVMKLFLEEVCQEAGVRIRYHTRVTAAVRDDANRLTAVITESKSGREAWTAPVFVDCTGDGDVGALAGCRFSLGEPETGRTQPMSLIALLAGYGRPDQPPFCIPDWHQRTDWLRREIERGGHSPSYARASMFLIHDGLCLMMANHQYGVRGVDAEEVTRATLEARAEVHRIVAALRSLGGDWAGLRLVATAEQIGVREGRRLRGRYEVSTEDLVRGARFPDAVCEVRFGVDVHALDPTRNKGIDRYEVKAKPYHIPLRALIAADVDGLMMAGRCISGDFLAHSSYRVTGNAVAMGEAAGVTAALAAGSGRLPHEVPWCEIEPRLQPRG